MSISIHPSQGPHGRDRPLIEVRVQKTAGTYKILATRILPLSFHSGKNG